MKRVLKSSLIILGLLPLLVLPAAVINPVKIFGTLFLVATYVKIGLLEVSIKYIELALIIREGLGL